MAINLKKGQKVSLKKENGQKLTNICLGINWGMIESKSKGLFGFGAGIKKEAVDLDASVAVFGEDKNLLDIVYFGELTSKDGSIKHSGDDLTGDSDGDDNLDNEVITINLDRVQSEAKSLVFILNSFRGHDFATIPFATIRIYEGTPLRVDEVFAKFDIARDEKFAGYTSLIMGKVYKRGDEWKFDSIGSTTKDRKLEDTVKSVIEGYL